MTIHAGGYVSQTSMSSRHKLTPIPSIRAIFSRVSLHWGFVVRIPGASAAQTALSITPPTTVVGSFAAALFRALGLKDLTEALSRALEARKTLSKHFNCALEATLTAVAGLTPSSEFVGLCVHQEPSRLTAAPYKTGGSWAKALKSSFGSTDFYSKFVTEALPVQAAGAAYGPGALLDLLWIFDVEVLTRYLNRELGLTVSVEEIDRVGLAAAYGVSRIGSKEGLTSVEVATYVRDGISLLSTGEVVRTHLYVPAVCVEPVTKDITKVSLWDLKYGLSEYFMPEPASEALVVPTPPERVPSYRIVSGSCVAYVVPAEVEVVGVGSSVWR